MMAVAALAACSKSDINYDAPAEIGFAPVASKVTKSVAGYNGDAFDGVFPTDIDLYIFANAQDENSDGTLAETWNSPYFANALFEWNESKGSNATVEGVATTGAYAGDPTRYWPNVKTLKFAGYSDACGVNKTAPTMAFANNTLTIPSYTQNNATYTEEGTNDLMWFPCDGNAYSKQANEVVANMKHACSWITINVKGDDVTANSWLLNSLVVKQLAHSGSVICGEEAATWTIADDATKEDEDYYKPAAGTTFSDALVKYEDTANNFIVLPQSPTDLEVSYTYTSDATNNLKLTETKSVSLDYDEAGTAWQSGVHYIYNITITATEILIDPVVKEWTDETIDLGAI